MTKESSRDERKHVKKEKSKSKKEKERKSKHDEKKSKKDKKKSHEESKEPIHNNNKHMYAFTLLNSTMQRDLYSL